MAETGSGEARHSGETPGASGTGRLAIAELVAGELDRCERLCRAEPAWDRSLADELSATIAYLRGDFSLATKLTGGLAAGSVLAEAVLSREASNRSGLNRSGLSRAVLDRAGLNEELPDNPAAEILARQRMPFEQRAALATLIGEPTTARFDADEPAVGPAVSSDTERAADLEAGIAAASILGSNPSPTPLASALEVLTDATTKGRRVSLSVPVSLERAIASGQHQLGDHEVAADGLAGIERHWRAQQAYTELAEVLVLAAQLNAKLGRRPLAERQASEAYALAERLGMTAVRNRALALHHPSSSDGVDLGSPNERLVLMSDVVSSTKVSVVDGDEAYVELIMTHHGTVRRRLVEFGGTEFSEGGDSLFAWFESPEDTLDCALAILDDVANLQPTACGLEIRVSIAGGKPFFRDGRPYGSVVNRASLIVGHADPGTVVVDEATLTRLGPVVGGFASETIDLGHFGQTALGHLAP